MSFCLSKSAAVLLIAALNATGLLEALQIATQTQNSDILIGVANPQSGGSSPIGRAFTAGSLAFFDLINERGGIHGRRVRMIVKDSNDGDEPPVGVTDELISEDHVLFLFDYVGTPTTIRVLPLLRFYDSQQVVDLGPMTGSEPPRKPPYSQYVFPVRASYRTEAQALVDYLYARGSRRFGFLGQQDSYGKTGEVSVIAALAQHNLSLEQTVWYQDQSELPVAISSMKPQAELLRQSNVDAVIAFAVLAHAERFIRDARSAHWQVAIANTSIVDADVLLTRLRNGPNRAGVDLTLNLVNSEVVPSPFESQLPLVRQFREHVPPADRGYVSLEGWLNAAVATEALRRSPPDVVRPSFLRALKSLHNWDPGLGVRIDFSQEERQGLNAVWVSASHEGKWLTVAEVVNGHYEEHPQ